MRDWNLVQIEGEEPVEQVEDPNAAKGKPPAKAPPKAGSALEEISDNRPRIIQFIKDYAEEGALTSINEDTAFHLQDQKLVIKIIKVDRET